MTTFLTSCGSTWLLLSAPSRAVVFHLLPYLLIMCQSSIREVRQRIHSFKPTGVKSLVSSATLSGRIELIVGHLNVYPMR